MSLAHLDKTKGVTGASAVQTLQASALQAATPIVLALAECDEELREDAIELFKQLASGELDQEQQYATTALLAEILFPNCDGQGQPGLDLAEAEEIAAKVDPDAQRVLERMDKEEAGFARRLREIMEEKGLTQAQLAELVGIGQPAISMMLNRSCRPQRKTVLRFAEALGVPAQSLWPGDRGDTAGTTI
jgi:predicted XRE-type DNA-binding protein